ncbi:hypothetical protein [Fluviicola sp.]|uniref:hypothetical protein n=1 Tax=Fluviicola sp. TaxID=1917219 RepID=UPI0031D6C2F1
MKTKNYLLVIITAISIGFFSLSSCMRKPNTCKCYFLNGDKFYYDMRALVKWPIPAGHSIRKIVS